MARKSVQCMRGSALGEKCKTELKYTKKSGDVRRGFFCKTHNVWTYERPVRVEFTFEDGEVIIHDLT